VKLSDGESDLSAKIFRSNDTILVADDVDSFFSFSSFVEH
jgi:hypothetical protein